MRYVYDERCGDVMIRKNTPIETYQIKGRTVYVKREDLCTEPPGPPFSKCRGLYAKLKKMKRDDGVTVVGYVETPISMAGWGVAWVAQKLGMKAVIFDPQYLHTPPATILVHREKWKQFNPDIIPIKAGMTCVNQHIAKKMLKKEYGKKAVMLPIGISFRETIMETGKELLRTILNPDPDMPLLFYPNHIVVCVGSGTICSGLLKGLQGVRRHVDLIGVMAYDKNMRKKRKSIFAKAGVKDKNTLFPYKVNLTLINEKWEYTEPSFGDCPFPCHAYYDLKAWSWLERHIHTLKGTVLFWNIGSEAL